MRIPPLAVLLAVLALAVAVPPAGAQPAPTDPTARLRSVLPAEVAERVLATIAEARAQQLPADALAQRALKFAARGVPPASIATAIAEQADRMGVARSAIQRGRPGMPNAEEVEAGAEVLRRGVDDARVTELARSAPAGRSLAVPLYVVGSLVDRGLPSDDALRRVQARLANRAADVELERMPAERGQGADPMRDKEKGRPAATGRDLSVTRSGNANVGGNSGRGGGNGRPAVVPGNTGKDNRPPGKEKPGKPDKPDNPGKPDKPDKPDKPGKGGKP